MQSIKLVQRLKYLNTQRFNHIYFSTFQNIQKPATPFKRLESRVPYKEKVKVTNENEYQVFQKFILNQLQENKQLTTLDVLLQQKDQLRQLITTRPRGLKTPFYYLNTDMKEKGQTISQYNKSQLDEIVDLVIECLPSNDSVIGLIQLFYSALKIKLYHERFYEELLKNLARVLKVSDRLGVDKSENLRTISNLLLYLCDVQDKFPKYRFQTEIKEVIKSSSKFVDKFEIKDSVQKYFDLSMIGSCLCRLECSQDPYHRFMIASLKQLQNDETSEALQNLKIYGILKYLAKFKVQIQKKCVSPNEFDAIIQRLMIAVDQFLDNCPHLEFGKLVNTLGKLDLIDYQRSIKIISIFHRDISKYQLQTIAQVLGGFESSSFYKYDAIVRKELDQIFDLENEIMLNFYKNSQSLKYQFLPSLLSSMVRLEIISTNSLLELFNNINDNFVVSVFQNMPLSSVVQLFGSIMKFKMPETDADFTKAQHVLKRKLFDQILEPSIDKLNFIQCAFLMWNLIIQERYGKEWNILFIRSKEICSTMTIPFNDKDYTQLALIAIALKLERPKYFEQFKKFINIEEVLVNMQKFEKDYSRKRLSTFNFEQKVIDIVKEKFKDENVKFEVFTGISSIDIAFPDYKLAIEVDGSVHSYQGQHDILASKKLKYRLFDQAHLNYIVIDHAKYYPNQEVQEQLLCDDIRKAIEISKLEMQQNPDIENIFARILRKSDDKCDFID